MASHVVTILLFAAICLVEKVTSNLPPHFINFPTAIFVEESVPVGSVLDVLEAEDSDDDTLSFVIVGEIAMSVVALVKTSPKTANITLIEPLDRETNDKVPVTFGVQDQINTRILKQSTIYVNDVNDNAPLFQQLPYKATVPEDAAPGYSVFRVRATDPDTALSGLVSYSITTPQSLFSISLSDGVIRLEGQLDYEKENFYQLSIEASDGGSPPLSSSTDIILLVGDVQDTAPFFLSLPYMAAVLENATVGTSVFQALAMDGDQGVPHAVNYSFTAGSSDYFRMDPDTGLVTVARPMNREEDWVLALYGVLPMTVLTQEVTDTPQGPSTATAPATIQILDVNDQVPTFSRQAYSAQVSENSQVQIPVTFTGTPSSMMVTDLDQGDNGRFRLYLEHMNGSAFDIFSASPDVAFNEVSVIIRVKEPSVLDYEKITSLEFYVVAEEHMTAERHTNKAKVTVNILDVNDNWPKFENDTYVALIPENSARGTLVTVVTATDKDSGKWGTLKYGLRGASASLFTIDPESGAVTVAVDADRDHHVLDREKQDVHYVSVEAVDGGDLRTSVQLEIRLTDENDNAPQISRDHYEGYILENQLSLERPVIIEALDIDLPPNNVMHFSILSGDPKQSFAIGETDGKISVTKPIDYEAMEPSQNGIYNLIVLVEDSGSPPLNSTVPVDINVQDVNDNSPVFDKVLYTHSLPEDTPPDTSVLTVLAVDKDSTAPNNEPFYRIESGTKDKFLIDTDSGVISVESAANLDWNLYGQSYSLTVVAVDRGTPQRTGSAQVTITITDVNNKDPEFIPDRRSVKILENTTVGSTFFTYTARDIDVGSSLQYRILEDGILGEDENRRSILNQTYLASLFNINPLNGSLSVRSPLSREIVEELTVPIFVEDVNAHFPPKQNATALLFITLLDVNNNPPIFQPSNLYYARISEASKPGTEVKQVLALDADKNDKTISYSVVYDDQWSRAFSITEANKFSGVVTLDRPVDHEQTAWINITVRAVDGGSPPLSSLATLHVLIEDVNDNSPEWTTFPTTVEVWENATIGSKVTTVFATDEDDGEFGKIMYFMKSGDDSKFQMNNQSGVLSTAALLDREVTADYRITIEARDNNDAPISEQRKTPNYMHIKLKDINDNQPVFAQQQYTAYIQENVKVGSPIQTVRAEDADEGLNAQIFYSIDENKGNATGMFKVDPVTGAVQVSKSLSGRAGFYVAVLVATDQGTPALKGVSSLQVTVEDVNDHKPQIDHPPENQTIYIWENTQVGTWVTQVKATDKDEGTNGMVEYRFIKNPSGSPDWEKFNIDQKSGNITIIGTIDREAQDVYFLEVQAYDLGNPSYDDQATLIIEVLDMNDNLPAFSRTAYPPPYRVSVEEEVSNVLVANLALAVDADSGNHSVVCYYLVGGDGPHRRDFTINRETGQLYLGAAVDREKVNKISLVIKASDDCTINLWESDEQRTVVWDSRDLTLLLVEVSVNDINDNPPRFTRPWLTAGVTKDTQFGETVLHMMDYVFDPDVGNNSMAQFYVLPPINYSEPLGTQLRQRGEKEPFVLGRTDGILYTNIYFQTNMQGYMNFIVFINDSNPKHSDRTNVSIYLLNEEQRVKVILRGEPDEVGDFKDIFADFLTNTTGAIINVDKIRTHMNEAGKPDPSKTDMFIHAINRNTSEVLDAKMLIDLIDKNDLALVNLFKQYKVIEVVQAVGETPSGISQDLTLALIIVACVLVVIIIIVSATFFTCRNKYKRKLKAATAMAFGSRDSGLNHLEMPGTNMHAYEGSNPIWLEQNNWPHDISDTESKNSLEVNNITPIASRMQGYDEQEITLDMNNDEYDSFNKVPLGARIPNSDINQKSNHKVVNGHARTQNNVQGNGVNGSARNGNPTDYSYGRSNRANNLFDNHGFEMQATEI